MFPPQNVCVFIFPFSCSDPLVQKAMENLRKAIKRYGVILLLIYLNTYRKKDIEKDKQKFIFAFNVMTFI